MTEVISKADNNVLPVPVSDAEKSTTTKPSQVRNRLRSFTSSSSRSRSRSRSRSPYSRGRYRRSRSRRNDRFSRNPRFNRIERHSPSRESAYRSRNSWRRRERSPRCRRSTPSPDRRLRYSRRRSPLTNNGDLPRREFRNEFSGMLNRDRSSLHFGRTQSRRRSTSTSPPPTYIDHGFDENKADDYNPPPPSCAVEQVSMPPLSERFHGLIAVALRRRPQYGVVGGFAHLVLSNKSQIPVPTLIRQAKELSVVIERQLKPETANPDIPISYDFDWRRIPLVLPGREMAISKAVFDRPEIPVYSKPEDEKAIMLRLAAVLSAKASKSDGIQPFKPYDDRRRGKFDPHQRKDSAFSRLGNIDPRDIPKGPSYFLHDDREGRSFQGNFATFSRSNFRRDSYRDLDYGGRPRQRRSRHSSERENSPFRSPVRKSKDVVDNRWKHDKYMELEEEVNHPSRSPSHVKVEKSTSLSTGDHPVLQQADKPSSAAVSPEGPSPFHETDADMRDDARIVNV